MAEFVFADFSGGLNLSASPDKVPERECILADNVNFDELGSVRAAGASAKQNSSAYTDGANTNVRSFVVNPTVRHVALIGNDVFGGTALSGLSQLLDEANSTEAKTRFTEMGQRVIYDTAGTPRYVDNGGVAHTVDWAPPSGSQTDTGPNSAGAGANVSRGASYPAWTGAGNIFTSNDAYATVSLNSPTTERESDYLQASTFGYALGGAVQILGIKVEVEIALPSSSQTINHTLYAVLLKGGTPIGDTKSVSITSATDAYVTLGSTSELWGTTWTPADINAVTFGVQLWVKQTNTGFTGPYTSDWRIDHVRITVTNQGGPFTVALGGAGNPNGTYTYKATHVDVDGNESEASTASASISPANQQVNLTLVGTGDSKTVKRYIYRSGGSLTFYYRIGEISDNATTSFTDNVADTTALTDGILLAGEAEGDRANTRIGASASVKYPAVYYDRLFWANQATGKLNQVIWSKTTHPFAYPSQHFFNVGDGKPVTAIIPFLDDLIIFKTDSIWRLTGSEESSFQLTRTPATVGCEMPFTVVKMQDRIMFCNSSSIWYFDGVTARKSTNRLDRFFNGETVNSIAPIVVNSTTDDLAEAAVGEGVYYLAYSDNGTSNNRILRIDMEGGTISRYNISALSIAADPTTQTVYYGDSAGFIKTLDDLAATNDATASVSFAFQTKFFYPKRGNNVSFTGLELEIDTSSQNITVEGFFDGDMATTVSIGTASNAARGLVYLPIPAGASRKARSCSIKISGTLATVNESNSPAVTLHSGKLYLEELKQRSRTGV